MRRRVHYCHCSSEKGCRRLRAPEQQVVECTFELQVERAASTPQYTGYAGYARYSVQVGYWRNMGHPNSRTPKSETIERSQNRVEPRGSLTPVPVAEWLQIREIFIAIHLESVSFL